MNSLRNIVLSLQRKLINQKINKFLGQVVVYYFLHNYCNQQTYMEKYFSSTYHSGIGGVAKSSAFSSMIALSPKQKPKQQPNSYRAYQDKSYNFKNSTFKKELNKTVNLLPSHQRISFKSLQKKDPPFKSSKNIAPEWKPISNTFLKRKELTSYKQISISDQKQLRESDSTLCQSPKAHLNCGLKITDFKKLRLIGNGKYGSVYMVKHLATGFISALKIIRKIDIDGLQKPEKDQMINQLIREIKIQMFLDHPNLVKLYAYFSDDYNIYLLMELGCDGQLYDLMKKKPKFHQESVSILTREILQGLNYMHKKRIIHRDIKPENIVLIHGFAKICDFGWSVYNSHELRSTFCGTPLYLSPQILKGNMYNEKIDTWAIGTLAYELFTAQNPFKIKKKEELSKIITEDFVMKTGSPQLRDFITSILKKDPAKRPDTKTIKGHEFLRKYKDLDTSQEICSLVYKREVSVYKSYYK